MLTRYVIVVAGGTGTRMGSTLPKQFLLLNEKPVLMHSMERFYCADSAIGIVLVLSEDMVEYWKECCKMYNFRVPHHVINGGTSRYQSVRSGLRFIREKMDKHAVLSDLLIAIHDGARPLISSSKINSLFEEAMYKKAVVPAIASTNSIRLGDMNTSVSVDRNSVWQIQTPQIFSAEILFEAYEQVEDPLFTDDASVVEKMGTTVSLHQGDYFNIKITFPEDLDVAQIYLKNENKR